MLSFASTILDENDFLYDFGKKQFIEYDDAKRHKNIDKWQHTFKSVYFGFVICIVIQLHFVDQFAYHCDWYFDDQYYQHFHDQKHQIVQIAFPELFIDFFQTLIYFSPDYVVRFRSFYDFKSFASIKHSIFGYHSIVLISLVKTIQPYITVQPFCQIQYFVFMVLIIEL